MSALLPYCAQVGAMFAAQVLALSPDIGELLDATLVAHFPAAREDYRAGVGLAQELVREGHIRAAIHHIRQARELWRTVKMAGNPPSAIEQAGAIADVLEHLMNGEGRRALDYARLMTCRGAAELRESLSRLY